MKTKLVNSDKKLFSRFTIVTLLIMAITSYTEVRGQTNSQYNTKYGDGALQNNIGSSNTAFGYKALFNNKTGHGNIANGYEGYEGQF